MAFPYMVAKSILFSCKCELNLFNHDHGKAAIHGNNLVGLCTGVF